MGNQYNYKHGMFREPEYKAWGTMVQRCTNPNNRAWIHYGGRGITICERWRTFSNFIEDMGRRPSPKHSIDRIDNSRGYEPANCRWANRREQSTNRRNNVIFEFRGEKRTITEWAELHGINRRTLDARLQEYGWTIEEALTLPPQKGLKPERLRKK